MDKVKNIWGGITSGWNNMEKPKKIRLGVIVSVVTILVLSFAYLTQRTEYAVLFSELEEADAGAIVEDLETKGMDYQLEDNGTTILIDEEYIDKYRIDMAVDGLMPANSTGFEIFDTTSMMATDDDRAIMFQRALSGELERAISSLGSVKSAKVLLSIPEDSIFQNPEYQQEGSASVVLETVGSQPLSHQTIQGIASLVSGAVDHLPPANIQIVDTNGNLLSASLSTNGSFTSADVVTQHQSIKQSVESDLQQKVLNLLAPVYGIEKVRVTVNAELDFDAIEREETTYGDASIRSQTEHASGSDAFTSQVQGGALDDNGTPVTIDGEEAGDSTYDRTTNFELDTTTEKIVRAPGAVESLTASVVVMDNPVNEDGVQNLVEHALGINEGAFGTVYIEFLPQMAEQDAPTLIGTGDLMPRLRALVSEYGLFLAGGLVFFILLIVLIRMLKRRSAEEDFDEFEIEEEVAAPEKAVTTEVDKEVERKIKESKAANEKEDKARSYAKENPELASELIKIWLKEK